MNIHLFTFHLEQKCYCFVFKIFGLLRKFTTTKNKMLYESWDSQEIHLFLTF